ncbi:hypothetical protein [Halorubellus salinus]|uniref:hypothetical protein n=1 Tax=Halorubellus salinus TaxID=755309 RepID=UPI001D07676A|nr:hypothetical protein [Halorubellus salinus]
MGDETERRDVLASLTVQGVGPGVRISEIDHEEPTYDVPSVDADDDHVFRLAMSSAVLHDDPDEVADVLGVPSVPPTAGRPPARSRIMRVLLLVASTTGMRSIGVRS